MAPALAKSEFTPTQTRALELAAECKTLKDIAKGIGVSVDTLANWQKDLPAFATELTRARKFAIDCKSDELLQMHDAELYPDVQRARLIADNIKWLAGKRYREVYGDKLDVEVNMTVDIGAALAEAKARLLPPMRHPAEIEDGQFTDMSIACESGLGDKQSPAALPGPRPDIFS